MNSEHSSWFSGHDEKFRYPSRLLFGQVTRRYEKNYERVRVSNIPSLYSLVLREFVAYPLSIFRFTGRLDKDYVDHEY